MKEGTIISNGGGIVNGFRIPAGHWRFNDTIYWTQPSKMGEAFIAALVPEHREEFRQALERK